MNSVLSKKRVVFLVNMKKKNIVFLLRFRVKQSNKKKRKICSEKERCKATVVKKKKCDVFQMTRK